MHGRNSTKEVTSPFKMKMHRADELPSTHCPQYIQGFTEHFQGGDVTFTRTTFYLKNESFKRWF